MRILRVRRGFTTNSSASSEWIPTPGQPAPTPSNTRPTTDPNAGFVPETKVILPTKPGQSQGPSWSDGAKVGGLVGIVALVFVADRLVRMIRGKKKGYDDAGE